MELDIEAVPTSRNLTVRGFGMALLNTLPNLVTPGTLDIIRIILSVFPSYGARYVPLVIL